MNTPVTVALDLRGRGLSIETGRLAKQASGSALVRYGDSVLLATATASKTERVGIDFFPLTVDYQERMYAAGKIPGGFFKREGRASERRFLRRGSSTGRPGRSSPTGSTARRRS